jgi:hypothetical protein
MKHFYSSLVLLLVASFGFAQNAELYGVVRVRKPKTICRELHLSMLKCAEPLPMHLADIK